MSRCANCDEEHGLTVCDSCAAERYAPDAVFGDEVGTREDELADVLEFFRDLDAEAVRGIQISLSDVRARLERGEHRR